MTTALKLATPPGYEALNPESALPYLARFPDLAKRLGGKQADWRAREVGDGNLNLVFLVEGPAGGVCVKQALPYVRLVGESWPLPLARAHYEHLALTAQAAAAPVYVPAVYHYDAAMALIVMEYLRPHIILRKGLVQGIRYPMMAKHLGEFLAFTLYASSDMNLAAEAKRERMIEFARNHAMCKISEDLIFDEPYFDAPLNRHTPGLEDIAAEFRRDAALKIAAQEMKWRFLSRSEALLHGDLHTGSVMVTEHDTRAIDPEFACYGPMGFDIGALIANFLLSAFSQAGHAASPGARDAYTVWVLQQIPALWESFAATFANLWKSRCEQQPGGDVYGCRLFPSLLEQAVRTRLDAIWDDALGFAGLKMIRRILGLAHVEDMESIQDVSRRAACERSALRFARSLLVERGRYGAPELVAQAAGKP